MRVFPHQHYLMVLHWSLSDSKSPIVSRIFRCIRTDLNNAIVWIVSTRPVIFKFSIFCIIPSVIIIKAPITIVMNVHFTFHVFSIPLQGLVFYPFFHILPILLCGQPGQQSSKFCKISFLLLIIIRSGNQTEIRGSICISRSLGCFCVLFSL